VTTVATEPDPDTLADDGWRVTDPMDSVRQRMRYSWTLAAVWLVYLWSPITEAWDSPDPARRWFGLLIIVLFAGVFLYAFAMPRPLRRLGYPFPYALGFALTSVNVALVGLLAFVLGAHVLPLLVYVGVMAVFLLPRVVGPLIVVALAVISFVVERLVYGVNDLSIQFSILLSGLVMWSVRQVIMRNRELAAARNEITRLAIAEERARFGRDLHDILGHSLTVVAVKAELAGKLVRLDVDRAEAEIADIERLAREALADVRTAVGGYRDVTLAGELVHARTALSAAGIDAELPEPVSGLPADRSRLFGWVVREGVTNVVRHSGASHCRIAVTPHEVRISDDGRGPVRDESSLDRIGSGLRGLRERAEAWGGSLTVGRTTNGGFDLTVRV
jgi:two-component system, NarL family, sensor histidine kinase DesK